MSWAAPICRSKKDLQSTFLVLLHTNTKETGKLGFVNPLLRPLKCWWSCVFPKHKGENLSLKTLVSEFVKQQTKPWAEFSTHPEKSSNSFPWIQAPCQLCKGVESFQSSRYTHNCPCQREMRTKTITRGYKLLRLSSIKLPWWIN